MELPTSPPQANWRVIFCHSQGSQIPRIVASYSTQAQALGHADLINRDTNGKATVIWSRSEDLKLLSVTQ